MSFKTHKPPTMQQLKRIVDNFNRLYPVGTAVMLRRDTGEILTRVLSPAIVLQKHSAVAWFEGISGAYSIEDNRVRPSTDVI